MKVIETRINTQPIYMNKTEILILKTNATSCQKSLIPGVIEYAPTSKGAFYFLHIASWDSPCH